MVRFFNFLAGIFHRLCWCMSWMHNWLCGSESIFPPYMNLMIKHPCKALYALLCAFKKDLYKTNSTLNIRAMKFSAAGLLGHSGRDLIITYSTFKSHLGSCMDIWKLVKNLYFSLMCHVYVSCDACSITKDLQHPCVFNASTAQELYASLSLGVFASSMMKKWVKSREQSVIHDLSCICLFRFFSFFLSLSRSF